MWNRATRRNICWGSHLYKYVQLCKCGIEAGLVLGENTWSLSPGKKKKFLRPMCDSLATSSGQHMNMIVLHSIFTQQNAKKMGKPGYLMHPQATNALLLTSCWIMFVLLAISNPWCLNNESHQVVSNKFARLISKYKSANGKKCHRTADQQSTSELVYRCGRFWTNRQATSLTVNQRAVLSLIFPYLIPPFKRQTSTCGTHTIRCNLQCMIACIVCFVLFVHQSPVNSGVLFVQHHL